jgi:hypothetical protein
MTMQGRRLGPDATALQKSSEVVSSDAVTLIPERSPVSDSRTTVANIGPTQNEIARVAYHLWLDNGCPPGSHQEDWLRAEAMLKDALVAKFEYLSKRPSIPCCGTRTEYEMLVEFRVEGHWEVWESEWGGARWVWDFSHSMR